MDPSSIYGWTWLQLTMVNNALLSRRLKGEVPGVVQSLMMGTERLCDLVVMWLSGEFLDKVAMFVICQGIKVILFTYLGISWYSLITLRILNDWSENQAYDSNIYI